MWVGDGWKSFFPQKNLRLAANGLLGGLIGNGNGEFLLPAVVLRISIDIAGREQRAVWKPKWSRMVIKKFPLLGDGRSARCLQAFRFNKS